MHKDTEEKDRIKGNGEKILVIEDEEILVEITKISLEMNGYSVISARNGIEGIDLFMRLKDAISGVICDLNMPIMDGSSALHSILHIKPEVKVVIVSGSVDSDKIPQFSTKSNIQFLQKPYRSEVLIETLQKLFNQESAVAFR